MNSEELYLLRIIDDITWDGPSNALDEGGNWVKVTSNDIEAITDWNKTKIRIFLIKLRNKKLISNGRKFTGANAGWFATVKGNRIANYNKKEW